MSYRLDLRPGECLMPTPSGVYHAACTTQPERVQRLLFMLMEKERLARLDETLVAAWARALQAEPEELLGLLYTLQQAEFIEALPRPPQAPSGALEKVLPPLLRQLSSTDCALLTDRQGLYIANTGFTHETAEELSALGADLAALHARHGYLINNNLGLRSNAWGLLFADGGSQLGFWSLNIGRTEFNLIVGGVPYLNQRAFRDLVWSLSWRYSQQS